jgi:hypothetical protein
MLIDAAMATPPVIGITARASATVVRLTNAWIGQFPRRNAALQVVISGIRPGSRATMMAHGGTRANALARSSKHCNR